MRANGEPIRASSAAYTTSQASARPSPVPRQAPWTAAMVGIGKAGHARHQRVDDVAKDRLAVLVQRIRLGEITPAAERAPLATNEQRPGAAGLRRRRGSR